MVVNGLSFAQDPRKAEMVIAKKIIFAKFNVAFFIIFGLGYNNQT